MGFEFNGDQIDTLKRWKSIVDNNKDAQGWMQNEAEANTKIRELFKKVNFENGGNLTEDSLYEFFSLLREFSSNRNLSNLLYRNNGGIEKFNELLRNLYYGKEPLATRINSFFNLKGMGIQTVSQFLVALNWEEHPFITNITSSTLSELLNLDSVQEEEAKKEALQKYGISDSSQYLERTIDLLTYNVIFEKLKSVLNLKNYPEANCIIWYANETSDAETPPAYTSVSLESDLKNYLAGNSSLIEDNLTLIQKEYDTREVGRIDLLCSDRSGNKVIVELKKGRKSDEVVGQTLRYMGWIESKQKANARAIIIVNEPDERLNYALLPLKEKIKLKYYKVKFEVSDTP